ncbi:MAG TPA: glycosyltransferase family 4 protein [Verrucomicrobiae bacterium]|nr:glycosyltransferase family 4 protein [Verrucomicrobiae bacterium]
MRILSVCGAGYVSGKEIVTLSLLTELKRRGHTVSSVMSSWSDGEFARRLDQAGIPAIRLPLGFVSKTWAWRPLKMTLHQMLLLPKLWTGYARLLADTRPDIVLHTTFHHVVLLSPFMRGGRDFFHVHECFQPSRWYQRIFRVVFSKLAFVAVSQAVRRSLLRLGIPPDRIEVVPNGVSPGTGESTRAISELVRIVVAGQVSPSKGLEDLIDALAMLRQRALRFECRIFGKSDTEFGLRLRRRVDETGLSGSVRFMGFESDIDEIYAGADISAVPSRLEEGFGLAAAEPAIRGVPVVATRNGGLCEIVEDGVSGLLVAPERPDELAEALGRLIRDVDLRTRLGAAARQRAMKLFSVEHMSASLEAAMSGPKGGL